MDQLSFSTQYIKMYSETDMLMSSATSFLYLHQNILYFITNGHNITRINPETGLRISDSAAFPVRIKTKVKSSVSNIKDQIGSFDLDLPLYSDDEFKKPRWYVHPTHTYKVDIVAIPWVDTTDYTGANKFFPVNVNDFTPEFGIEVADSVFILGYPFNITGQYELPVWKKGTVASEPSIDIDNLPKFYVDTATKSGMSGSPVIMQRIGLHRKGSEISLADYLGTIRNFAGVYSGRIGYTSDLEAQLGIVWKPHLIDEILNEKLIGDIDFQNI